MGGDIMGFLCSLSKNYAPLAGRIPGSFQSWLYRFGMERGYLDAILSDGIALPFFKFFRGCDRFEQRAMKWVSGSTKESVSDELPPTGATADPW